MDEKEKIELEEFKMQAFLIVQTENKENIRNSILNIMRSNSEFSQDFINFHQNSIISVYSSMKLFIKNSTQKIKNGDFVLIRKEKSNLENYLICRFKCGINFDSLNQTYSWIVCDVFERNEIKSKHWLLKLIEENAFISLSSCTGYSVYIQLSSYLFKKNFYINTHIDSEIRNFIQFHIEM